MSIDKIKQFMEDHKKELIAATVVVGGVVLVILGCKHSAKKHASSASNPFRVRDIPIPEGLKDWNTSDLWVEGEYLNAIIGSVPLDDLGELGKQYLQNGFAQPGDIASVVIGVKYDK